MSKINGIQRPAHGRRRATDLAVLAPYGCDSADPTWKERYTAAPDQPGPILRDAFEDITVRPATRAPAEPPWRCPNCGGANTGYLVEAAFARGINGAPVTATWDTPAAACLVTMSTCGHSFRALPVLPKGTRVTTIEFDPATALPVAVRHESSTGWGPELLELHGRGALEQQVMEELVEEIEEGPCRLITGTVETTTTVDGDVTTVTAWSRCTAPNCVAHGAAIDVLNTEPFTDLALTADFPALVAAARTQLDVPTMEFNRDSAEDTVVWAWRSGTLREVTMYLCHQAYAYAAQRKSTGARALRAAEKDARTRAAALGLDLTGGPVDLTRLRAGTPEAWEQTARALHGIFSDLAAAVEAHTPAAAAPR